VADEIVLVQAVHDQYDGALLLVVEPTVEGMVEPLVGRPPLGSRQGHPMNSDFQQFWSI